MKEPTKEELQQQTKESLQAAIIWLILGIAFIFILHCYKVSGAFYGSF